MAKRDEPHRERLRPRPTAATLADSIRELATARSNAELRMWCEDLARVSAAAVGELGVIAVVETLEQQLAEAKTRVDTLFRERDALALEVADLLRRAGFVGPDSIEPPPVAELVAILRAQRPAPAPCPLDHPHEETDRCLGLD